MKKDFKSFRARVAASLDARHAISRTKKHFAGLRFTLDHEGKMSGMQSLSTSAAINPYCQRRQERANCVCSKCYACALMAHRKSAGQAFAENTRILTSSIIEDQYIPIISAPTFRLEAFGELNNTTQVINYFNLCYLNPKTTFALWTKNPRFISEVIKMGYKKPSNLVVILSSSLLNKPAIPGFDFIDKVFTVYTKRYIAENQVPINCGARSCLLCGRCYKRRKNGAPVEYVNEILKGRQD